MFSFTTFTAFFALEEAYSNPEKPTIKIETIHTPNRLKEVTVVNFLIFGDKIRNPNIKSTNIGIATTKSPNKLNNQFGIIEP